MAHLEEIEASVSASLHGYAILVVDDEPAIRQAMAKVLGGWGCQVLAAESAQDALSQLATSGFCRTRSLPIIGCARGAPEPRPLPTSGAPSAGRAGSNPDWRYGPGKAARSQRQRPHVVAQAGSACAITVGPVRMAPGPVCFGVASTVGKLLTRSGVTLCGNRGAMVTLDVCRIRMNCYRLRRHDLIAGARQSIA